MGISEKTGIPAALSIGAVVSGAMFGDNLSMISDTTIAATRTPVSYTHLDVYKRQGIIGAFHSTLLFWGKAMDVIQHESTLQEAFRHGFKVL